MCLKAQVLRRVLSHLLLKVKYLSIEIFDLCRVPKLHGDEFLEAYLTEISLLPQLHQESLFSKADTEVVFLIAVFAVGLLEQHQYACELHLSDSCLYSGLCVQQEH